MTNLSGNKFTLGARHRGRRAGSPSLRLTSMIDMFTILLVFLLKSYSAEGQIMTISDDLQLPESSANKNVESTPVVIVTEKFVLLDDDRVAEVSELYSGKTHEIMNLKNGLLQKRQISESLGRKNASYSFKGEVTIQGDKDIPFRILKKIMVTCGSAGYGSIKLAVNKVE